MNIEFITPGKMMALAICFLVITSLLVTLKLVGRRLQKLAYGADDAFMLFSWISFLAMSINMIIAVTSGAWGQPAELIEIQDGEAGFNPLFFRALEFFFIQDVIFPAQLASVKLSILFFYRRVLCPERRGFLHWSTIFLIVVTALWGTIMFFVYLFQCGPTVSDFWANPLEVKATCLPGTIEWFMTISDFVLDVVIFFLPIHRIATLQIRASKKVMIIGVFALGAASVVASLVRGVIWMPMLKSLDEQHAGENNVFLIISSIMYWGMFESGFALMAACLPALKYFVDRTTAQFSSSYGSQYPSAGCYDNSNFSPLRTPQSAGRSSHSTQSSRDLEKGSYVTSITASRR